MTEAALWTIGGLAVATGVLVSIMSALLERSGLIRLRHWAEESGGRLEKLYQRKERFEIYRLLLSLISRTAPLVVLLAGRGLWESWAIALGAATGTILVSEVASRLLVAPSAEEGLRRLTRAYRAALGLLSPFIVVLRPLFPDNAMERREESMELDEASEGEIDAYISVGQREGILEPGEELLVRGVVEFGDTLVKKVMTPRIDMVAAPITSDPEELLELFLESGHSRLPLFSDSADTITRVVHLRELVAAMHAEESVEILAISMPVFIIPETKRIAALLREFQDRRQQLAVVVDEFGGTAGVVTVEDLIEEIVGEIADEHEEQNLDRVRLAEEVWILSGSCEVDELEGLFGMELPEVSYETVGGLVFTTLGHLPRRGEHVCRHGLRFEVLDIRHRRIQRVRVERAEASPR